MRFNEYCHVCGLTPAEQYSLGISLLVEKTGESYYYVSEAVKLFTEYEGNFKRYVEEDCSSIVYDDNFLRFINKLSKKTKRHIIY